MRERFFLIPPPESHPPQPSPIVGEGMGGDEFPQNVEIVRKQPPCLSLEEEIKLVEKKTEDIEITQPSSIMGEDMGEADIQREYQLVEKQQFQPSQVSTSGGGEVVEEERTVTIPPPPTPSASLRTGRGGGNSHPLRPRQRGTFPPPVPLTEGEKGGGGRSGGSVELLQRTSDFEIPPLLEGQHISLSLCETLDRVLNTGVVVHGDITISVANIDLIYIGLRALLTSVETARQAGINHITDF